WSSDVCSSDLLPVETSHVAAPPTSSPVVGWVCCACRASGRGGHGLDLEVLLEALAAHLAADAGLLVAAERDVGAVPLAAVDAERAGADPCDDLLDALGIGAPHGAGLAVGGVAGDPDRVSVTVVGDHHEHGPEDLLLRDAGGVVQARDEGRLDPEALVLVVAGGAAAAELDGASLFAC